MTRHDVTLHDRYNLAKSPVLLNGTQALVRLMLMQKARDLEAGLNTAGYVTGYRGSPMGAVDLQMARARDVLEASDVRFQPGLNEDLAATALWGTQQAELRGEGRFDGVFGLWYGKGPGVDRSGDAMRHANMAGTSSRGGVIMALGDDHTGESSTTCHQSDWAAVDAYIPVLSPAGVQEVLDYGLYGFALSRYSGLWTGLKLMKDTVEVTSVVDGSSGRMRFVEPDFAMPEGGLNIRLADHWIPQEARITDYKRFAAEAFSHANGIDRRVHGRPGAKIGFCAAGKNWLDLEHALSLLGVDGKEAERLGLTAYKIGQTFPLDMAGFRDWAEGLDLIVVVEEKRKLIEVQAKEAIFDDRRGRRIYGWRDDKGNELFPTRFALDPALIAEKIGGLLLEEGRDSENVRAGLRRIEEARGADNAPDIASRIPYFCSGCPHNSSTLVPEGSRAYAGIGCHFMAQWMDRDTQGFTHMGAEGANWVGEAPFSTRSHVFQNLGDGTYNHSGVQAIRFALMAGVNITYKILYNDAVAMTGGQANDGGLGPDQIARELAAMGVRRIACVYDEKEEPDWTGFPRDTLRRPRSELDAVQKEFAAIEGVTAIVYIQTCAAEKRRRRKRGIFPDAGRRVFIDPDVCEGCGDCGIRSNCVSIVPLETELGRKRAIDQSSCNSDFSCLQGFCPSFMTVEGGAPRRRAATGFEIGELVEPDLPTIDGTWNVVVAGVGGTGVVTIGAVLAMAAHLDEKGVGMMEMAGLAQKGGAVHIHCRIADDPSGINAIRVAVGECDALIGGDLVVSAGAKTLGLLKTGRTGATVNAHEIVTGEFARNAEFSLPAERMRLSLEARLGDRLSMFDASELSRILTGDAIFSNMIVFGAAWQYSLIPVSRESILRAIELNGAAVEGNKRAFEIGRWAALNPEKARNVVDRDAAPTLGTLEERIAYRAGHLEKYQSKSLAERYRALVDSIGDPRLREAAAKGYHKLLAYKDEYEVARLLSGASAKVRAEFDGARRISYHLAPPFLARTGPDGRPAKYRFGSGIALLFPLLASLKWLRGTPFDPFGRTAERRMERELIRTYEADMAEILRDLTEERLEPAVALAELPLSIRGFGPVKLANAEKAERRREELLTAFRAAPAPARAAE